MLDPDLLIQGYRLGVFPMATRDDSIEWFSPDPRAILPLENFHVPHALRRLMRRKTFEATIDKAFPEVIQSCAQRKNTWINHEIIDSYTRLHELGHAHSLECWQNERLVGGIYGVSIGGFFAGESMFHRVSNASKVALFHLVEHLRQQQFELFDIQMLTPITEQLGGSEVPRDTYLKRLTHAVEKECRF